jgi:predicted RNA binding protein YcfA (HicA-like mRNA interferase family)
VGKLRVLSGQEVCAILERHEFSRIRQRGSHIVMQRAAAKGTITVPVPDQRIALRYLAFDHPSVWCSTE